MPQVIAFFAGSVVFWYAWRWIGRDVARVEAALRRISQRLINIQRPVGPALQADPATGVYRPAD